MIAPPMTPIKPPSRDGGLSTGSAKLKVLDLFSGIGAYSLGLERTGGFQTVAFCEINAFCRGILRKHWPDVPIHEDVATLTGAGLRAVGIVPDWIVAGWPCQGNSPAGTGLGMDDPRSGLWAEIARLAGEIRPAGLLLENSSNLLSINDGADFGTVLGDLAALGYDAEWHCLSAAAFDAPHIRDRVWIVATLPHAEGQRCDARRAKPDGQQGRPVADGLHRAGNVAHAERFGQSGLRKPRNAGDRPAHSEGQAAQPEHGREDVALAHSLAPVGSAIARHERHTWEPEPNVGRVASRVADRVERIHALGNLNPPIIPEAVGRAILSALHSASVAA